MGVAVGVLGGISALLVGIPAIWTMLGNVPSMQSKGFVNLGRLAQLKIGEPQDLSFVQQGFDAYVPQSVPRSVWAVRTSATDVVVYSSSCTHLGCKYDWDPRLQRFVCPCHNSVFGITGRVISGPAPRRLDTLQSKVVDGNLYVHFEQFKPGVAEKTAV